MEEAPEDCVGPTSEQAGKAAPCEGCPNQNICASGTPAAQADAEAADVARLRQNMAGVKKKILVLSGKGGVGKSTVSTYLSMMLTNDDTSSDMDDSCVGLLDIDICGPSIPRMLGLLGSEIHRSGSGWQPVFMDDSLCVMSIGFMLDSDDSAVIWRGPKKNGMIKQFLRDCEWGHLQYLVVDTPPGTSDEHLSIVQYLQATEGGINGAVIVTTPQEVALLDVRKEINFCKKLGVPIVGVVENMSGFVCPKCTNETQIFSASTGGAAKMCADMGVPFLGQLPIDPRLARCCDEGTDFCTMYPDSPAVVALKSIVAKIKV